MYYSFFIHASVEGHLNRFYFLAGTNKAAKNIVMIVSLHDSGIHFAYMPRSGIVES